MGIKDIIDLVARAGPDWAPLLLAFLATYATARYLWKSRGKRGWQLMSDKWFGIVMLSSCLKVTTNTGSSVMLIDGGYCANNPSLYAIADAVNALGKPSLRSTGGEHWSRRVPGTEALGHGLALQTPSQR